MGTTVSTRSATGITERKTANQIAQGMVDIYGEPFTILFYPGEGIFDVEPSRNSDTPGLDFVVEVVYPTEDQLQHEE